MKENQKAGIPLEYFYVQYLRYSGEYKDEFILSKMKEKFELMGMKNISSFLVLNSWKNYLNANATEQEKEKFCSRKQIAWGIIVNYLDPPGETQLTDGGIASFPANEYSEVIRSLTGKFVTVSRILGDYIFKKSLKKMKMTPKEYAENNWKEFIDMLDGIDYDEPTKKQILCTVLLQVITKSSIIMSVKKVMKIED